MKRDAEDVKALEKRCAELGLHPISDPMGDDHHTDAPFSDEDKLIGDALAWFLGGLFIDKEDFFANQDMPLKDTYWFNEMTSVDQWTRVARALRIHGLAICDSKKG